MRCARRVDVLLALGLALAAGCAHRPDPAQATLPESRVALRLLDVEGETLNLGGLRGQVVLLTVMTTWSEPALLEVPLLTELQRDYAGSLTVVAVFLDPDPRVLAIFRDTFQVPYRVTRPHDPAGLTGAEGPFGPIGVLPTSVLLDRDGRIAARMDGVWPPGALRRAVQLLVGTEVAPDPGTQ
jgi:thiol-disulfide isomerase/thioredoxin